MRLQLKPTLTLALLAVVSAACTPQDSYVMTPNTPTPKVYSYSAAAAKSGKTPVTHSHSGKVHTHILPPSGIIHTHVATATRVSYVNTPAPQAPRPAVNYQQPRNTVVVRPVYRNTNATTRSYNYAPAPRYTAPQQPRAAAQPRYTAPQQPRVAAQPRYVAPQQPRANAQPNYDYNNQANYDYSYGYTAPQATPDYNYGSSAGTADYNYTAPPANNYGYTSTAPATTTNNDSYYSYGGAIDTYASANPASKPKANDNYTYYSSTAPKSSSSYSSNYDYSAGNTGTAASSSYYNDYSVNNLKNPGVTAAPASSSYGGGNSYTVQKGDTVFQVMRNTGVYWKDIISINGLQPPAHTIVPGQVLKLR